MPFVVVLTRSHQTQSVRRTPASVALLERVCIAWASLVLTPAALAAATDAVPMPPGLASPRATAQAPPLVLPTPTATAMPPLLAQRTPIAGLRYHAGPEIWRRLGTDESVQLIRDAANPYDERAVRVEWHDITLGYLPRKSNDALAWALDQGYPLHARVLRDPANRGGRSLPRFHLIITLQ